MSAFSRRFAAQVNGYMREHAITQGMVAAKIGRAQSYVSDRVGGRKPVDVEIVDAVAALAGEDPLVLLNRITASVSEPVHDHAASVHSLDARRKPTNVGGLSETDLLDIASREQVDEALSRPHAAKRGVRKADQAPYAE